MTAPDNVLVCGRLAGGALASAQVASVPWHGRGMKLEVYGSEGTLVASTIGTTQIDPVSLLGARSEDRDIQELSIPGRLSYVPEGAPFNVARMYQAFADAIRTGQRLEPDFDTTVVRHKLLDAVERASAQQISV